MNIVNHKVQIVIHLLHIFNQNIHILIHEIHIFFKILFWTNIYIWPQCKNHTISPKKSFSGLWQMDSHLFTRKCFLLSFWYFGVTCLNKWHVYLQAEMYLTKCQISGKGKDFIIGSHFKSFSLYLIFFWNHFGIIFHDS